MAVHRNLSEISTVNYNIKQVCSSSQFESKHDVEISINP